MSRRLSRTRGFGVKARDIEINTAKIYTDIARRQPAVQDTQRIHQAKQDMAQSLVPDDLLSSLQSTFTGSTEAAIKSFFSLFFR